MDFDTAMRIESRYLAGLMVNPVAKNMINTFFFNLNAIKSGQSRPKDVPRYKPKKVGILGAGMMGAGIAYSQASRGIASVLKDVSAGKGRTRQGLQRQAHPGARGQGPHGPARPGRTAGPHHAHRPAPPTCRACDLIIEAVFENRELKAKVTQEAEPMLAPGGFFASNTSTLPISGLATASANPAKFIGIHFFSPVDKMKLVEIIRGKQTDDETVARAFDYVQSLGKIPIVVNDSRGFYTSRTFGTFVMEGAAMLDEGIPAPVIENAAMQVGMPVGPLAVIDETSLSLSVHVMEQTRADYAAEGKTFTATAGELLVERMVKEFKRAGRAAGGGFYDYPEGQKKRLWPELKTRFEKPGVAWNLQDVKDRILYRQAVETARCLSENVLTTVHDGNIGSIFGIGFPAWTGGALQFIYGMGIDAFIARADELAAKFGPGFALTRRSEGRDPQAPAGVLSPPAAPIESPQGDLRAFLCVKSGLSQRGMVIALLCLDESRVPVLSVSIRRFTRLRLKVLHCLVIIELPNACKARTCPDPSAHRRTAGPDRGSGHHAGRPQQPGTPSPPATSPGKSASRRARCSSISPAARRSGWRSWNG